MRIVYLLLHDFRFASLGIREFALRRFHFSKEYARRMADRGHEVKLYTLGADVRGRQTYHIDGYELKAFRPAFRFPPFWGFGNDHSIEVLRELERDSPDVVHFHNYYLWNFPYVSGWAKKSGSRLVAQYHGTDPIRALKGAAFLPSLELCDRVLVPVREEEAFLTGRLRLPRSKVVMAPSTGVDTDLFNRVGSPGADPMLLYVGRIPMPAPSSWEKAPHLLLPILKAVINAGLKARLVFAGDGPGADLLRRTAAEMGMSGAVDFLGQLDQASLPSLYSRALATFVPMRMADLDPYWGGTVQESLACGTPVIAFNDEFPGRMPLGLLVPTNPKLAATAILGALNDDGWLSSVRANAPGAVRRISDWTTLTDRLEGSYRQLVSAS